jgi:L-ribulose-5-phosphate 4-epimerase
MTPREIRHDYEANTGHVIVRRFARLDPAEVPAVLVYGHGPFCWGPSAGSAVHTAFVVEALAHLAYNTVTLNPHAKPISSALVKKHFSRKHGPGAYYGQR